MGVANREMGGLNPDIPLASGVTEPLTNEDNGTLTRIVVIIKGINHFEGLMVGIIR